MDKKILALLGAVLLGIVVLVAVIYGRGNAQDQSWGDASTDPQTLMIPRWFLESLTLDGAAVELQPVQQSLQFEEGGRFNGEGGCNNFFGEYEAANDGAMTFGPIGATKMMCPDNMQQESAYFQALAQVQQFRTENGKLILSSQDGQTELIFTMPPK